MESSKKYWGKLNTEIGFIKTEPSKDSTIHHTEKILDISSTIKREQNDQTTKHFCAEIDNIKTDGQADCVKTESPEHSKKYSNTIYPENGFSIKPESSHTDIHTWRNIPPVYVKPEPYSNYSICNIDDDHITHATTNIDNTTHTTIMNRLSTISSLENSYDCEQCGKGFIENSKLTRHMRIHTGGKPHGCEQCGKSFKHNSELKRHLRIHTGDKPYKCDMCNKSFTQNSCLKKHVRIHTGYKPYECEQCGNSFTQSGSLTKHMRIHTGDKPYGCELCGKRFRSSSDLIRHVRIHR